VVVATRLVVSITAGPNPLVNVPTTFIINAAAAAGSNATIQHVLVTFGDNPTTTDLGAVSGSATTQHVYAAPGTYTASATATDSGGATATATTTVVVVVPVTVSVAVSPNAAVGVPTQFTVTVVTAPGVTIQSVGMDYGDLASDNLGAVPPFVGSHTYIRGATVRATAIVTIAGGIQPVTVGIDVVVAPCAPFNQTLTTTSIVLNALNAWPAGGQSFLTIYGCSVSINFPSGTISNLSGDTWTIGSSTLYSACTITPQAPLCGGVGSSSSLLSNGRPYCSNAAATVLDLPSQASAIVQCR
jgi:PKD repeat protein